MLLSGNQRRRRPWIAMILAYVFVVQAMLVGSLGAQHAAATAASTDPAVICFGMGATPQADDGTTPQRLHHSPCSLCTLASLPALAPVVFAAAAPSTHRRITHASTWAVLAPTPEKTPRLSQGPPLPDV